MMHLPSSHESRFLVAEKSGVAIPTAKILYSTLFSNDLSSLPHSIVIAQDPFIHANGPVSCSFVSIIITLAPITADVQPA